MVEGGARKYRNQVWVANSHSQ
ncbi:hypothetical protein VCHC55A1_1441, partial [Vibrio cholerae HC-55A1]